MEQAPVAALNTQIGAPLSQLCSNVCQDSASCAQAANKVSRVAWKGSAEADERFYQLGLLLQSHMQEWVEGKEKTCKKFIELLKKCVQFKDLDLKLTTVSDKCNDLLKLAQSHRASMDVGKNYTSGKWADLLGGIMAAYDQIQLPNKHAAKKAAGSEKAKAQPPNMACVISECDSAAQVGSAGIMWLCYLVQMAKLHDVC